MPWSAARRARERVPRAVRRGPTLSERRRSSAPPNRRGGPFGTRLSVWPPVIPSACSAQAFGFRWKETPFGPDESPQAFEGCFTPDNYRQYSASIGGWFHLGQKLSTSLDHRL